MPLVRAMVKVWNSDVGLVTVNFTFSPGVKVNLPDAAFIDGDVSFGGGFVGDYLTVASTNSKAFPVWMDTRGTDGVNDPVEPGGDDNQDIFFAPITPD